MTTDTRYPTKARQRAKNEMFPGPSTSHGKHDDHRAIGLPGGGKDGDSARNEGTEDWFVAPKRDRSPFHEVRAIEPIFLLFRTRFSVRILSAKDPSNYVCFRGFPRLFIAS